MALYHNKNEKFISTKENILIFYIVIKKYRVIINEIYGTLL